MNGNICANDDDGDDDPASRDGSTQHDEGAGGRFSPQPPETSVFYQVWCRPLGVAGSPQARAAGKTSVDEPPGKSAVTHTFIPPEKGERDCEQANHVSDLAEDGTAHDEAVACETAAEWQRPGHQQAGISNDGPVTMKPRSDKKTAVFFVQVCRLLMGV
eukprot:scaffold8269_cov21-Prasinocladus_malaysianus.AAC.1